jgi:hypothetical protein
MPRQTTHSVTVDPNVRCRRVYPVEDSQRQISELKTVGLVLTRDQAIHLARVLLAASQDWEEIDITAYRFSKRKTDGTYHITVTSGALPTA